MKKLLLLIALSVMACTPEEIEVEKEFTCVPGQVEYAVEMADPVSGLIEGDIIPDIQIKGVGVIDKKWPNKTIPYYYRKDEEMYGGIMLGFDEKDIKHVEPQLREFEQLTGFIMVRHESLYDMPGNGLIISPGFGASSSYVGMQPTRQSFRLIHNVSLSTTLHELGHAIGLHHEHNRSDRDNYVDILWENIPEKRKSQFNKAEAAYDCGEFDFESVMIYPSHVFGENPAMVDKEGNTWTRGKTFSEIDLKTIHWIYNTK